MTNHESIFSRISTLALALASVGGCALPVQTLEAGADTAETGAETGAGTSGSDDTGGPEDPDPNDPAAECLLGSWRDAVGYATDSWSPGCPVVCEEGWAHGDAPLDIVWSRGFDDQAGALIPGGLVARPNGDPLVVASAADGRALAHAVNLDAQTQWEIELPILPGTIRQVRMLGTRLYVLHDVLDGMTELVVLDDEGATPLAGRGYGPSAPIPVLDFDVSSVGVAVLLNGEGAERTLELLDHELSPRWSEPGLDWATTARMGSTPESAIVMASAIDESIVAYDENASVTWSAYLDAQFVGTSDIVLDGERVLVSGATMDNDRFDGAITSIVPESDVWYRSYGRAYSWCPDPGDDETTVATADFFPDLARLSDGTLLLAGAENYEGGGLIGSQPLVLRFGPDAEFLGRDRGLWQGYTHAVLAGPGDLAFMLATDDELGQLILRAYQL